MQKLWSIYFLLNAATLLAGRSEEKITLNNAGQLVRVSLDDTDAEFFNFTIHNENGDIQIAPNPLELIQVVYKSSIAASKAEVTVVAEDENIHIDIHPRTRMRGQVGNSGQVNIIVELPASALGNLKVSTQYGNIAVIGFKDAIEPPNGRTVELHSKFSVVTAQEISATNGLRFSDSLRNCKDGFFK